MSYDDYKLASPPEHKECSECEGKGHFQLSNCCGAQCDSDMLICYECKEHCDLQECEECDGTGTV